MRFGPRKICCLRRQSRRHSRVGSRARRPGCLSHGHRGRITGLEWVSTNVVASVSEDGTGKLWNIDEVTQLKSWTAHSGGASGLRRAQTGDLVTVGRNRRATLWDAGGNAKRSFTFPGDIPSTGVPTHDAKRVIGTDWTGQVYVWNAADGQEISRLSLNPATMAEQFAAAQKVVDEKAAAARAAEAAHKAVLDQIAKAKADQAALTAAVTMRQKAVTDSKAALDKLVAEKQKPAQAKAATAAKAVETATAAKAATDKALAAAAEADKPAAQAKTEAAVKMLNDAQAAKNSADKALATINTQVTQAGTIHAAANKSLAEAQTKQKTGQPVLTKRLADLAKANSAEQAKVTAAGAALTSAQEDADHLRLSKTFAALYTVRREVSSQDAELAQLKSESESAQTALTNAKAHWPPPKTGSRRCQNRSASQGQRSSKRQNQGRRSLGRRAGRSGPGKDQGRGSPKSGRHPRGRHETGPSQSANRPNRRHQGPNRRPSRGRQSGCRAKTIQRPCGRRTRAGSNH